MARKDLDVASLEVALCKASAYMSIAAKPEDTAIFVGTTKSGKSTLINYLIGNQLIGERHGIKICVKKANNSHGPEIGLAATSETAIPSRYVSDKLPGYALWDAPGFNDNRGDNTDICNAFFTCELFKNIRSAKIILVVDIATFQDDSMHAIRTLLGAVESLLGDKFKDSFPGITLIITKADVLHGITVTKDVVTDFLQMLLTDDVDLSGCAQDLIRYLICNPQNIGFFKRATLGPITDDIEDGIVDAVSSSEAIPDHILKTISPSISESAKVSLFKVREQLSSMQKFMELQDVVVDALQKQGYNYDQKIQNEEMSTDELNDLRIGLGIIKDSMNQVVDESSFERMINVLKNVGPGIENYIVMNRLCEKAKYMEFVDKLLNLKDSRNFSLCIKRILELAKQKVEQFDVEIKCRIGEIDAEKSRKIIERMSIEHATKIEEYDVEIEELKKTNKELEDRWCIVM